MQLIIPVSHLADGSVEVVVGVHGWRWDVVGAPPDLHLRLAVFGRRLGLVEPRESAVVALVQTPGAVHGQPHLIDAVQHQPQCPDRSLQHRRVADVKLITRICKMSYIIQVMQQIQMRKQWIFLMR